LGFRGWDLGISTDNFFGGDNILNLGQKLKVKGQKLKVKSQKSKVEGKS
jgi:hypothetical protein